MLINSSAHSMPKQEDIDALALLSPAKVVSYEMENGQRRIGIVAAGLAETLPQAVEKGSGGGCTLWVEQLVPVLVKAVQQLRAENAELRKELQIKPATKKAKAKANVPT